MTNPEQLPLRDIHLPEAIGWWPPAPGWWILLTLIGLTLLIGIWRWRRAKTERSSSLKSLSLIELEVIRRDFTHHGDPQRLIRELSALLRRISMSYWPRERSASLTGMSWLSFLEQTLNNEAFINGPGKALIEAPYRCAPQFETEPLLELCRDWINALPDPAEDRQS